jgi:hypothetical protein
VRPPLIPSVALVAGLVAVTLWASCSRPETTPAPAAAPALWGEITPVVSMRELMADLIDPASDSVFNAVSTTIGPKGIVEVEPSTDEDWARVRSGAVTLAEGISLLVIPRPIAPPASPDRPSAADSDNAELPPDQVRAKILADPVLWNAKIAALRNINLTLLDVVKRRNVSELVEAGAILDQACETCHLEFWYPGEKGLLQSLDRTLRRR